MVQIGIVAAVKTGLLGYGALQVGLRVADHFLRHGNGVPREVEQVAKSMVADQTWVPDLEDLLEVREPDEEEPAADDTPPESEVEWFGPPGWVDRPPGDPRDTWPAVGETPPNSPGSSVQGGVQGPPTPEVKAREEEPTYWVKEGVPYRRVALALAARVRYKLGGVPKATVANRLMVQTACAKILKGYNVRTSEATLIIPVAVTMTFVATAEDVWAAQLAAAQEVGYMRERFEARYKPGLFRRIMAGLMGVPLYRGIEFSG